MATPPSFFYFWAIMQFPPWTSIDDAARLLHDGLVVAIPTETVYGLGANALDAEADEQQPKQIEAQPQASAPQQACERQKQQAQYQFELEKLRLQQAFELEKLRIQNASKTAKTS